MVLQGNTLNVFEDAHWKNHIIVVPHRYLQNQNSSTNTHSDIHLIVILLGVRGSHCTVIVSLI